MMRKFQFRLEPVLKHREIIAEQAAVKKTRAQEEYQHNHDCLSDARNNLAGTVQDSQALNPFDMFNRLAYCDYMTGEIKRREITLNRSQKKLDKCRNHLVKAMQERSVMETLREKQLQAYNQLASSVEQKEIDELAVLMYNAALKNR